VLAGLAVLLTTTVTVFAPALRVTLLVPPFFTATPLTVMFAPLGAVGLTATDVTLSATLAV
jgi:hypothetical protein